MIDRILMLLMIVVVGAFSTSTSGVAAKRVALVIGNSEYQHVATLPNTRHDAVDVAGALKRLGFEVSEHHDLSATEMRKVLLSFGRQAVGSQMALVFYAGHGIELDRRNYLIPVDAALRSSMAIEFEAVPLDLVMATVRNAKALRLVMLDACRNNPFAASMKRVGVSRNVGRGFARVEPSVGTLVSYAAKEGTTATDGAGRNSPYTRALLANLEQPGLEVQFLFRKVRDSVLSQTHGEQEPFTYGSLPGERLYLKAPEQPVAESDSTAADTAAWSMVKFSDNPEMIRRYLAAFPNTRHAAAARERLEALEKRLKVVALPPRPAAEELPVATEDSKPFGRDLTLAVQRQLNRVGCNAGRPDGKWGRGSRRALQAFARHGKVKLASLEPSQAALNALAKHKARVCPLVCGRRQVAKGDRCVLKACPRGKQLNRSGSCIAKQEKPERAKKRKDPPKKRVQKAQAKKKAGGKKCGYCRGLNVRYWRCGRIYKQYAAAGRCD